MTTVKEVRPNGSTDAAADLAPAPPPKPDERITWPDPLDDAPWPSPYRAFSDTCTEPEPRLPRRTIIELARLVTRWFLENNQSFAREFGVLASLFQSGSRDDLVKQYQTVLSTRLQDPKRGGDDKSQLLGVVNQHDIANVHRAVWLLLYRALLCLIDINIHGDWGDPPAGGTSQGNYDDDGRSFHTNPNYYGSFAISTLDVPPPDLGIGEAARYATDEPIEGDRLPKERIRQIARALGRGMVEPKDKDHYTRGFYGDDYLYVVKSFYRDRLNHTSVQQDPDPSKPNADGYTEVIRAILNATGSDVTLPERLTDDDFADIHRGTWLFLAHRFYYLVGKDAFGPLADVDTPTRSVRMPVYKLGQTIYYVFEVPNLYGTFGVNLADIDPESYA
jgi:hypothetical protein